MTIASKNIRNICIIAHVDHGKTTLVDFFLRQSGVFEREEKAEERIMDSYDLEREKGITIMAKNTSIRVGSTKINIVDTPGHADFGGEVERIIGMVDGALLLVDAAEGPLPQTRFVLEKALKSNLKVILIINKVDRSECRDGTRIDQVINQTFDLFVDLGATPEQADFPILYACGRKGWCTSHREDVPKLLSGEKTGNLKELFKIIIHEIPPPVIKSIGSASGGIGARPFCMHVANLSYSDYMGQLAIGRVLSGKIGVNQTLFRLGVNQAGRDIVERFTVSGVYSFEGIKQVPLECLTEGDIGLISGSEMVSIGDTLTSDEKLTALPRIAIAQPTVAMFFSINTSPLAGRDGEAVQSRKLKDRLQREVRKNVALRFEETQNPDQFRMLGRGELQFAILIEQMRREGIEFMVGRPEVLFKYGPQGERLEPIEKAVLDVPDIFAGEVTDLFQRRKGMMALYEPLSEGGSTLTDASGSMMPSRPRMRLEFEIPTRCLLGVRSKFLTITKGEGLFSSFFLNYAPYRGDFVHRVNGAIVADRSGETVEYALLNLESRGVLFWGPGVQVYEGMIVGERSKDEDLDVNPCKEKKLTNVRAAHAEILVTLAGIRTMTLEQCIEWIDDDEWIEVTPKTIRIRKKILPKGIRGIKKRS